jgi:homoserine kinase
MRQLRVRVPASTANLGPGFDSLGLALCKYLTVDLALNENKTSPANWKIDFKESTNVSLKENVIVQILEGNLDSKTRGKITGLTIHCDFPIKRGLGSSAAAIVAAFGLVQLLKSGSVDRERLFQEAFALEGHPDNVAPAVYGHLCIATAPELGLIRRLRLADELRVFLLIPDWETETSKSREELAQTIPRSSAVHNIRSTAHLISCLLSGDFGELKAGLSDALHESLRIGKVPGLAAVRVFLWESDQTFGVFLSGSGPTLAAFCTEPMSIGEAPLKMLAKEGVAGKCDCVAVDYKGIEWESC